MKPRNPPPEQDDLLRARLVEMIDMRHELVKLEALIDWDVFEREWVGFFPSHTGRPASSPRLVAGVLYLQHAFALSDEAVVAPSRAFRECPAGQGVGREPILAAFLWRGVLSTSSAA